MSASLWTTSVASLAAGAAFVLVGVRLARQSARQPAGGALVAFSLYWMALGAYTILWGGLTDAFANLGLAPFPLFVVLRFASLVLVYFGLWGLTHYFAYLFTGRRAWGWIAGALYAIVLLANVALLAIHRPVAVDVQAWRTDVAYATPLAGPLVALVALTLLLPPTVGAVAFATLARKAPSREAASRVLLVSLAILLGSVAAVLARVSQNDFWQLLTRPLLGIVVAGIALGAYRHLGDDALERLWAHRDVERATRRADLHERIGRLV